MSKLAMLREERAPLAEEARILNEKYPSDMKMPATEIRRLDALLDKISAIDKRIEDEREHAQRAADDFDATSGGWRTGSETVRVMRTAKDFRNHYVRNVTSRGEQINITDFIRGVAGLPTSDAVRASLSVGTDTAGGYSVPSIVMPQILEALVPASAVLSAGAGIIPMAEGHKTATQVAIDNIPTAAWRNENGAIAESDPTFRAVVTKPHSLAFYFKVSRELLQDGANIERALIVAISQAFAKEMDRVALLGSGVAPEPLGLKSTPGISPIGSGANGATLTSYARFFDALLAIKDSNGPSPTAAIMSPRTEVKLGSLVDSTGQPMRRPDMLSEMKFLSTSQLPTNLTMGTSTDCSDIYIGDFTNMVFTMREQMSIMKLGEAFATTGQIGFLCHMRADVAVQYPKAFAVVIGVRP